MAGQLGADAGLETEAEEDLGRTDAFKEYKILIGEFSTAPQLQEVILPALQSRKGFTVLTTKSERKFAEELTEADYDLAWVVSGASLSDCSRVEFESAIKDFHESGGGLFVWAGEAPLVYHANLTIQQVLGDGYQLAGSHTGAATLLQPQGEPGQVGFARHLITTGLRSLPQASAFSQPASLSNRMVDIAVAAPGQPTIVASATDAFPPYCGRLVVDMGLARLADLEGGPADPTLRYLLNATCWVVGIDLRETHAFPLRGRLSRAEHNAKWIWQYYHGGWFNYDPEASDKVEAEYQNFLASTSTDGGVRSVQSGFFKYSVNFRLMTQTNILHANHTVRQVRRIQQQVYTWNNQ